ncbi:MAG: carboxy terminal-processing peptidase [Planctomycetia bacterium]|nr:carboxy terminal-processing peptidase [Planctomycetia bacterium]
MKLKTPSRTACTLSAGLLLLAIVTGFADHLAANHPSDETTTKLVCNMVQKYHISQRPIDDKISEKLLDRFLKNLDPQKLYFTQPDIDQLSKFKVELDDLVKAGNTQFAYDVWDMFLQRFDRQIEVAKKQIVANHDFTVDESIEIDAEKIPYAKSQDELNDRWRKRIKFELVNAKLDNIDLANNVNKDKPKVGEKPKTGINGKDKAASVIVEPAERLEKRYRMLAKAYHETEDSEKLEMYLSALTHCFDPHSSYMSPQSQEEFQIAIALNLDGIGAALRSEDGFTTVNEVVKEGAADTDGRLKAGDRITAVGQETGELVDIMEMKLSKVVRLIRGKRGTKVRLQVKKGDSGEVVVYELIRKKIELKNSEVKGEIVETEKRLTANGTAGRKGKVGVVNIPSFYRDFQGFQEGLENAKSTARDVQTVLQKFQKEGGVDVVVVDLRSNGGGALSEAIDVSGLFIDKGPIVQVKEQNGKIRSHDDDIDGVVYNGPLVVLCNKLSASASEIFAGAIKDYQRGIVVGDETTHGKGTVQNVMPVTSAMLFLNKQDRGALKLTIQQFYRVNGDSTQNLGVRSDIVLPSILDKMDLGEASLENALAFDRIPPASHASSEMITNDLISTLRNRSQRRVTADTKFQDIQKDIERYVVRKTRKSVSLEEAVLKAERIQNKKEPSEADIEDPSTRGSDTPIFADETYNNEVLQISLDYATLLRNPQAAQK